MNKVRFAGVAVACLLAVTGTMASTVAAKPAPAKPAAVKAEAPLPSLYQRLGGYDAVAAVVSDFADRLVADPQLIRSFGGFSADRLTQFKRFNTELVCLATGGPCSYSGRSMKQTHVGSKVTGAEFARVASHLVQTLEKFKVPEREKGELLTIVGSLRGDIVEGE